MKSQTLPIIWLSSTYWSTTLPSPLLLAKPHLSMNFNALPTYRHDHYISRHKHHHQHRHHTLYKTTSNPYPLQHTATRNYRRQYANQRARHGFLLARCSGIVHLSQSWGFGAACMYVYLGPTYMRTGYAGRLEGGLVVIDSVSVLLLGTVGSRCYSGGG